MLELLGNVRHLNSEVVYEKVKRKPIQIFILCSIAGLYFVLPHVSVCDS